MAACSSLPPPTTIHRRPLPNVSAISTIQSSPFFIHRLSSNNLLLHPRHPHRLSPLSPVNPDALFGRCRASRPGPPSRPDSDPPSGTDGTQSSDIAASLSRFQDTVQIFFAVLFWMSLFFWTSVWDGRNNGGRPNKRSRFRK